MIPSRVPAFRGALYDALLAADWLEGKPDISYGNPINLEREQIALGSTSEGEDSSQGWGPLGARSRDERFELLVTIWIGRPGDSNREAAERAWQLAGVIEGVLRASPTLGVQGVIASEVSSIGDDPVATDEGGTCTIDLRVRVQARI